MEHKKDMQGGEHANQQARNNPEEPNHTETVALIGHSRASSGSFIYIGLLMPTY
jgi:hypothetical protein